MNETLKRNWKPITAFALALSAVGAAAYYVNFIYIPGKERARAAELTAAQVVPETPENYNFTIDTSNPASISKTSPGTNSVDDSIKITTDADGNVTIDRTWNADLDELDTTTAAPGAPTANIGSGGGKITGTDGAYHGEQPTTTTPSTGSSGTDSTKPSTGDKTTTPPEDSSTTEPSDGSTKPSTPSKPSAPSTPGSSTPKDGDIRVVDGKEQMYWDGFGWVDKGNGGQTDYIEMPDELSGIQVGEMG
ncbi:MAG: hypothetical protein VB060_08820 [Oscillibacter sp.]|uniref:hypothetical protein n=1 Tax=uncultured Oscillibacter sp. TaxID=876091 RepID=UPI0025F84CCD|nr:hypothetical protein [Oscillibacter sp.]MEA4993915.1 hypothetical protein [Oscillibacter sp.]